MENFHNELFQSENGQINFNIFTESYIELNSHQLTQILKNTSFK